ncbi:MAG: IS4 family transposase [Cetobacterium sp.]
MPTQRFRSELDYDFATLSAAIDPQWIAQALAATGTASIRKRKMPAEQVIWLVIALALFRRQSIAEVVVHLDLLLPNEHDPEIANSALTQARQRLGEEPLAQLFSLCACAWDTRHQRGQSWRGLARYAIDGTTLRTSDSPENRQHFGAQAYASEVVSSYPQLRMVTLTALATHLIREVAFGEYGKNEMLYAQEVIELIPDYSLTVLDKGFLSAEILLPLQGNGQQRHWLIPAKSNTKWERLESSERDYRVRMKVSPQARAKRPELPEYWEARAIEVLSRQGTKRVLLTSLLDRTKYPAAEIAEQYSQRWRIETSYRELKQSLLGDEITLRSGTPATVRQEVWGAVLAYNLVRLEMAEVAKEVGAAATDLSFQMALGYLQYEWSWLATNSPGKIPKQLHHLRERLGELLLPKQRRGRECPRVVKALAKRYPARKIMKTDLK